MATANPHDVGTTRGRRRGVAATAAALAGVLLVSATVANAAALPDASALADARTAGGPDYAAVAGTVTPLSDAYVAEVLGRAVATPTAADDGDAPAGPATVGTEQRDDDRVTTVAAAAPPGLALGHAMTNDRARDAHAVDVVPFSASTDASNATRSPDEPAGCSPIGSTVWYRWRPSEHQRVTVSTRGTEGSSTLAVFVGEDPARLRAVGCERGVLGGGSALALRAQPDDTYWFQVTGPLGLRRVALSITPHGDVVELVAPMALDATAGSDAAVQPGNAKLLGMGAVSDGGRHVVWLEPGRVSPDDRNGGRDVVLLDRTTGQRELVSVTPDGVPADRPAAGGLAISPDGRFVVFSSRATDLLPAGQDTNGVMDTFVRDRRRGVTERVSVATGRVEGRPTVEGSSHGDDALQLDPDEAVVPVGISDDGRIVVFETNLPLDPRNDRPRKGTARARPDGGVPVAAPVEVDAYVHDRATGTTTLLGLRADGTRSDPWFNSGHPAVSGDGTVVAFDTDEPIDPADGDTHYDYYATELASGRTTLLSRTLPGFEAQPDIAVTHVPALSGDGRFVAFISEDDTLSADDRNPGDDVFVVDRADGSVELASVTSLGAPAEAQRDGNSIETVSMSADGRYVTFVSAAHNLHPGDGYRGDTPRDNPGRPDHDLFVHDRTLRTTSMVSLDWRGEVPARATMQGAISSDGSHVLIRSYARLTEDLLEPRGDGRTRPLHAVRLFLHERAVTSSWARD